MRGAYDSTHISVRPGEYEAIHATGMGKVMIEALKSSDNDLILLMQLFYVLIALAGNLIIDIVYGLVDPRVRVNK